MTGQEVICLYYHRVGPVRENLSIPPEIFQSQLEALSKNGYRAISLQDLISFLSGNQLKVEKPIIFSFDDGFLDYYLFAHPLLEKFRMSSVVFLVTDWVNDELGIRKEFPAEMAGFDSNQSIRAALRGDRRMFFNWETARELAKSGIVEFGSHTCTHKLAFRSGRIRRFIMSDRAHWKYEQVYGGKVRPGYPIFERASAAAVRCFEPGKDIIERLAEFCRQRSGNDRKQMEAELFRRAAELGPLGDFESEEDARARITRELEISREIIEGQLRVPCPSLCWPFGDYSELSLEIAANAGYKIGFSTERGVVRKNDNPLALKRYRVEAVSGSRLLLELSALRLPVLGRIISGRSRSRKVSQQI